MTNEEMNRLREFFANGFSAPRAESPQPKQPSETPGLTRSGHRYHFDVLPDGTALAVTPWTVEDWRKPIYREKQ